MQLNKLFISAVFICCAFGFITAQYDRNNKPFKVVCYLGSWANYRHGNGQFIIEDIDPYICTHLVYTFTKLDTNNQIAVYDIYLDLKDNYGLGAYERFNNLKQKNPHLTTFIAIGGWNEGSAKYSKMAANPESRKIFVDSVIEFLKKYGFDGLDLDWEYPASRGGEPQDKENYVLLLKELKEAFKPYGFLLTAGVAAGKHTIDVGYDVPAVSQYLDFINLMTYDFHGVWDTTTGHNAPLYSKPGGSDKNKPMSVDYAVKHWIKKGTPPQKIVLGMPLYGRSFRLQDPNQNGIGAPVSGAGIEGKYTNQPGMLGYNEICEMLQKERDWTKVFDEDIKAPYIYKGNNWIGYDDEESIALKVDYIKKMNLGGGMVWSIETDDFRGICGNGRYPLLTVINKGLHGYSPDEKNTKTPNEVTSVYIPTRKTTKKDTTTTLKKDTTTTTKKDTTPITTKKDTTTTTIGATEIFPNDPDGNTSHARCKQRGYLRDPNDCKKFIYCQPKNPFNTSTEFTVYQYKCAPGTYFSEKMQTCAFLDQVPECQKISKSRNGI